MERRKIKIGSIMWSLYTPMLVSASKKLDFLALKIFSSETLRDDISKSEEVLAELEKQDLILLYHTNDAFWDGIERRLREIGKKVPIICTASGGQWQLGALYLAKRIYPEHFEDVDPEEFHREYFEEWFDIPYQGVWVYP